MEVTIESVSGAQGQAHVTFDSAFGRGAALWFGSAPVVGRRYAVELTVRDTLDWGVDIEPIPDAEDPKLETFFAGLFIEAPLESCADDGCAVLRLGPNLLMLQTGGAAPPAGSWVRATVAELELYEIGT